MASHKVSGMAQIRNSFLPVMAADRQIPCGTPASQALLWDLADKGAACSLHAVMILGKQLTCLVHTAVVGLPPIIREFEVLIISSSDCKIFGTGMCVAPTSFGITGC